MDLSRELDKEAKQTCDYHWAKFMEAKTLAERVEQLRLFGNDLHVLYDEWIEKLVQGQPGPR